MLPALMRKFHEAKQNNQEEVIIWGSGKPYREFLHVDDLADACLHLLSLSEGTLVTLLNDYVSPALVNVGAGKEISITELAVAIKGVVGFEGQLAFDATKPDGTPRKLSDSSRMNSLGWRSKIDLAEGLRNLYHWYTAANAR